MNKKLLLPIFNALFKNSSLVTLSSRRPYFNVNRTNKIYTNALIKYTTFSTEPVDIVTYHELKQICEAKRKDILIIDVREPEELKETGVLPESINIPLDEIENVLKNISKQEFLSKYGRNKPSEDVTIIFSCKSGRRSAKAQTIVRKLGYKNVRNYIGGWLEWEEKHTKS